MSEAFNKLQNVKVEPALKNFQHGAVGSIEMLSVGFYGIIEAFKDEMEKSRDIEEKIENSLQHISNLKNELNLCNEKCVQLNDTLNKEMKKMKKCLSELSTEVDNKLHKMKDMTNNQCDLLKKECLSAVEAISNKVSKSLENCDTLKEDFENLQQETNDEIRSLSMRCEENKEIIQEQDNKFKDDLNQLTEILHHKALELDTKIENCLNETTNKISQFDEKQQLFQFETNKELSQKADIEDLKHKLDTNKYQQFIDNIYNNFAAKINENIQLISTNIDTQLNQQNEINQDIENMKSEKDTFKLSVDEKFNELESMIKNPVDVDSIKQEITQQIFDQQANFRQEIMELIQSANNGGSQPQAPSFGTQSGNCIACGRGPSKFQPLPVKSPSPSKKPKHGGGFNTLLSRRKSNDVNKRLRACGSQERFDMITSPKSASRRKSTSYLAQKQKQNKSFVENEPIRVKIPNLDDDTE